MAVKETHIPRKEINCVLDLFVARPKDQMEC